MNLRLGKVTLPQVIWLLRIEGRTRNYPINYHSCSHEWTETPPACAEVIIRLLAASGDRVSKVIGKEWLYTCNLSIKIP